MVKPWFACALLILSLLMAPTAIGQTQQIRLREAPDQLEFSHALVRLTFDKSSGQWTGLFVPDVDGNLIAPSATTMDFRIDGKAVVGERGAKLRRWNRESDEPNHAAHLHLVFEIPGAREPQAIGAFELTCTYTLFAGQKRVDRSMRVRRVDDFEKVLHFEGFVFTLPGVTVGDPRKCVVDTPGPFWPQTYVRPSTPYTDLVEARRNLHSAPDAGFGLIAITNTMSEVTLGSWMDTAGEVNYHSSFQGDGQRITLRHADERAYRLVEGMTIQSDAHRIEIASGGLPSVLTRYRQMCERQMPLAKRTPEWAREMVLLEVYPPYYAGGFTELADKLPFYREIGFNTLYLMPHWVGGYSPIDLFEVDSRFGTANDLKALVQRAHALDMRVLFDMVIHGFNVKSEVPTQRPEVFVRNEDGSLALHRTWKSVTTDWASPAYRQYMVDLVTHDVKTYDIDGYRVDAASYKGPNWDPNLPYPAYRSGSAAPELMEAMLEAMQQLKPDAVLLSEVFGPVFYSVCNLVHDNQTEAPQFFLEQLEAGKVCAADYKRHMANVFAALPSGANRVYYTRNHDTSWFYHFNGYTPAFLALEAIHAFCAIPEVFAGDPKHGPSPDEDPIVYDTYRKLFAARRDYPELARGELLLDAVACNHPNVFTALRRLGRSQTLVAVSLSDQRAHATIQIAQPTAESAPKTSIRIVDALSGDTVSAAVRNTETMEIALVLEPFQVLIGRL